MFPNLQNLNNTPVARTNIIQLTESPIDTIRRLLNPISNLFVIEFGIQRFKKEKKERGKDFYARIHREIKIQIKQKLQLVDNDDVKYELHRLPDGNHIYFYISPIAARHSSAYQSLLTRIEQVCQQLTANEHSVVRIIQGLFSLHLKIALLEKVSSRFSIEPVYFNSEIYLNARLTQALKKNNNTGVMEAFELEVYASEEQELVFTLHKRKFLVEPADELHLTIKDDSVWFNVDNRKLKSKRQLDARDSKLEFFRVGSSNNEIT